MTVRQSPKHCVALPVDDVLRSGWVVSLWKEWVDLPPTPFRMGRGAVLSLFSGAMCVDLLLTGGAPPLLKSFIVVWKSGPLLGEMESSRGGRARWNPSL